MWQQLSASNVEHRSSGVPQVATTACSETRVGITRDIFEEKIFLIFCCVTMMDTRTAPRLIHDGQISDGHIFNREWS